MAEYWDCPEDLSVNENVIVLKHGVLNVLKCTGPARLFDIMSRMEYDYAKLRSKNAKWERWLADRWVSNRLPELGQNAEMITRGSPGSQWRLDRGVVTQGVLYLFGSSFATRYLKWRPLSNTLPTVQEYGATYKRCNEHNPYAVRVENFICYGCRR